MARRLYELAATRSVGRQSFTSADWNRLGALRLEASDADAALEAFLSAGAEVSADAAGLPSALPQAPAGGKTWRDRCVPLDEGSSSKCRKRWLACFAEPVPTESSSSASSSSSAAVLIDARSLQAWRTDPTEGEQTGPSWLEESSTSTQTRCPVPDWPMGALDDDSTFVTIVRVDVCSGTAVEFSASHTCEHSERSLRQRDISPLELPAKDGGAR